jgi:hypothetical protein
MWIQDANVHFVLVHGATEWGEREQRNHERTVHEGMQFTARATVRRLRIARCMVAVVARTLGSLAASVVLVACIAEPRRAATADQAREQFALSAVCPEEEVRVEPISSAPPAPRAIARDPRRMAIWRASFGTAVDPKARQTIAVSGCGESDTYACWDWGWYLPGPDGRPQFVYKGTACNEVLDGRRSAGLDAIDRARADAEREVTHP